VRHRLVIFLAVAAVLSFDRRCLGELASGLDDVERPWAREAQLRQANSARLHSALGPWSGLMGSHYWS